MSKPFVYVGQSQAEGIYELCFVSDETQVSYHGTLAEFELLALSIGEAVGEQRARDAESRP